jgi:hypothetical protein
MDQICQRCPVERFCLWAGVDSSSNSSSSTAARKIAEAIERSHVLISLALNVPEKERIRIAIREQLERGLD